MVEVHELIRILEVPDDVESADEFVFGRRVSRYHAHKFARLAGILAPVPRGGQVFLGVGVFDQYVHNLEIVWGSRQLANPGQHPDQHAAEKDADDHAPQQDDGLATLLPGGLALEDKLPQQADRGILGFDTTLT